MASNNKEKILRLLKGIETGDPDSVLVVNEEKYIQHNPQTQEGSEGLAALFKRLSKTSPRVNIVRIFEDGDYVFAHTEYDFSQRNIGFELFRFEAGLAVEHWDNIQRRKGPNPSGHSMVDGETEVCDLAETQNNRERVRAFVQEVLIGANVDRISEYIHRDDFVEHNPHSTDDLSQLGSRLVAASTSQPASLVYKKNHFLLAEGNFVLSVCEGETEQVPSAFFDLFRLSEGKIREHWDTTEAIAPRAEWKNQNGKF